MIFILEPHGDDALISCWPLLTQRNYGVVVVTFGSSRPSEALSCHLPAIKHTKYFNAHQISWEDRAVSQAEYLKWCNWRRQRRHCRLSDGMTPWEWQRTATREMCDDWSRSYFETAKLLHSLLRRLNEGDVVFAPIGLIHPYHVVLADLVIAAVPHFPYLSFNFYSEAPYNNREWTAGIECSHPLAFVRRHQYYLAPTSDPGQKEHIFREVYPTETPLLQRPHTIITNGYWFYCEHNPMEEQ